MKQSLLPDSINTMNIQSIIMVKLALENDFR